MAISLSQQAKSFLKTVLQMFREENNLLNECTSYLVSNVQNVPLHFVRCVPVRRNIRVLSSTSDPVGSARGAESFLFYTVRIF